jgi:eukaryotic-like serine/threonine-protein kinase
VGATHHLAKLCGRSVPPSNLLVSQEGLKVWAKVSDFGLAKSFEQAGFSSLTRDDHVVGTIAFMAPEQALAARYARPSVDIYSSGATLYYLLSGCARPEVRRGHGPLERISQKGQPARAGAPHRTGRVAPAAP